MAFLAYSPNGKVEGELVYVNYGQVEDFEKLKTLGVNVTGKIAIMRYGKIFRGDKVRTSDEHIRNFVKCYDERNCAHFSSDTCEIHSVSFQTKGAIMK